MTATEPIFAKYQPQAVRRVPAGYHGTCAAVTCLKPYRRIGTGGEYIVNADGYAEHLDCNVAAHEALFKQEQVDSTTPPQPKGGPSKTG